MSLAQCSNHLLDGERLLLASSHILERDGAIVPIEVKAGNEASRSFDRMLARDDIHIGYKFINGNVGRQGKKITLPHYMVMFV